MLPGWMVLATAFGYLSLLFAIAYWGDRRADQGRSLIASSPYIYSLSIAVYCTSWTFYGSVGRAAGSGLGFLPIYLGPTLMFLLGWLVMRKILRISRVQRITSIADFIASRYGKSQLLGGLVTVIAVVGIMPYISLQLKAISSSFTVIVGETDATFGDTALYVALVMAVFSILFGTRHIDATEHHEGMVAAVAFESVVKLLAFLAVGIFVTFSLFDGLGDIFSRAAADPELRRLLTFDVAESTWLPLTFLAMAAILLLPRQFQVSVVENIDERHLDTAVWLFPLYLLVINIFVLPIALGGLLYFTDGGVDADTFVLALPLAEQHSALALFVFIGGLSAATGMLIVETIALSTMVCNDLAMPALLRIRWLRLTERQDLSGLLKAIRRGAIVLILLLGYLYFLLIGESYALVSIGLVSFAAAAQFAPALLGGIYWKGASHRGAMAGLAAGFLVWGYTLLLPSFAKSGWLPAGFIEAGPWGIQLLKPYALFGLQGWDNISHSLFWSLLANVGAYVGFSLTGRRGTVEQLQAALFVDIFLHEETGHAPTGWRGRANVAELKTLAERFIGREKSEVAFAAYARKNNADLSPKASADAKLVQFVERLLAGAIGAASARVMIAASIEGEEVGLEEILEVLDEASQVLEYSRRLEEKSKALESATADLRTANEQLQELDHMKDEFLSTVTHELRTPLTSIRSFSEILHDNPDLSPEQRGEFLGIVIRESERLTRLVNQVLDLTKIEAGRMEWHMEDVDLIQVVREAASTLDHMFEERKAQLRLDLPEELPLVRADRDHLTRVVINLLSNALKFCDPDLGRVNVSLQRETSGIVFRVADNGPGVPKAERDRVFDKFYQSGGSGNPTGSGLGLTICRSIVEHLGGRIWVEERPGGGAAFAFSIPVKSITP